MLRTHENRTYCYMHLSCHMLHVPFLSHVTCIFTVTCYMHLYCHMLHVPFLSHATCTFPVTCYMHLSCHMLHVPFLSLKPENAALSQIQSEFILFPYLPRRLKSKHYSAYRLTFACLTLRILTTCLSRL